MSTRPGIGSHLWLPTVLVPYLALLSVTVVIGADTLWLVAMGDTIAGRRSIPEGIPFAAADSSGWVNVPVLGELALAAVHFAGPVGLVVVQLVVVGATLLLTAVGARRLGASSGASAAAVLLVGLGALPSFGIVRAQLLSLVPFVAVLLVLRGQQRRPSRGIWVVVPLVAVWGNLHGGVLVGVAVIGCYLLLSRLRVEPVVAVTVGLATLAAVWVTPGLLGTGRYYVNVLTNEAAARGSDLWAPPSLASTFDVMLVVAAVVLVGAALRRRLPLWEYVAVAGLAVGTATAARHGIWLLLVVAPLAARGATRSPSADELGPSATRPPSRRLAVAAVTLGCLLCAAILVSRNDVLRKDEVVAATLAGETTGRTVLAVEPLAETLAAHGVRVWASNPIDAFSRADQAVFLDFLNGEGPPSSAALAGADVVVVVPGSPSAVLASSAGFVVTRSVGGYQVMECAVTAAGG